MLFAVDVVIVIKYVECYWNNAFLEMFSQNKKIDACMQHGPDIDIVNLD